MRHDYHCKRCETKLRKAKGVPLTEDEKRQADFEISYSVHATDAEIAAVAICPRCKSTKVKRCYSKTFDFYVAGNGLLDVAGCRREMAIYKLATADPYGYMRQVGEADDLKRKIKNQHKAKPKHFT